jgi:hypothetical protein
MVAVTRVLAGIGLSSWRVAVLPTHVTAPAKGPAPVAARKDVVVRDEGTMASVNVAVMRVDRGTAMSFVLGDVDDTNKPLGLPLPPQPIKIEALATAMVRMPRRLRLFITAP